jgi:hypothetical protein
MLQLRLVDKIASYSLSHPNTNLKEFEARRQAMYTGEQNSPFYTFFPHFAGRMGLHFGDSPKFIFSEWGEGFGEAVWGNIRQNGVYSPFCVFF